MAPDVERTRAAIMFTDIVGYTALMAESEEKGLRVREWHREGRAAPGRALPRRVDRVTRGPDALHLPDRAGRAATSCETIPAMLKVEIEISNTSVPQGLSALASNG